MKKITVLYISHTSALDGAPKSMLDMIRWLDKEYIDVLVSIPSNGLIRAELEKRHIKYFIVPYYVNYKIGDKGLFQYKIQNIQAIFSLAKIIKENKVDIVHSNSTAVDVGAIAAQIMRVPHIYHAREMMKEQFGVEYINRRRMKCLLKKSSVVISISKTVQEVYKKTFGIDTLQIYNGIDIEDYYNTHKPFFIDKTMKLLFCGQICETKGVFDAIEAVKILKENNLCSLKLRIVGKGDKGYIYKLKKYVAENHLTDEVEFLLFKKDLSLLRAESDIALTCSQYEALGRVTIEAMLAGMCVVGADRGGTKELIGENGEFGFLYKQGDSESLANVLTYIYTSKNEAYEKACKAQTMIEGKINPQEYGIKMSLLYRKVKKQI